jgi:hypothetical protein
MMDNVETDYNLNPQVFVHHALGYLVSRETAKRTILWLGTDLMGEWRFGTALAHTICARYS